MREEPYQIRNNFHYDELSFKSDNPLIKIQNKGKWIFCLIYIILFIFIFLMFLLNYLSTVKSFSDNKVVRLIPDKICLEQNELLNKCLSKFKKNSSHLLEECNKESNELQKCYDKVEIFNKKCKVYLSEYEKCIRDHQKIKNDATYMKNKCSSIYKDIMTCNPYEHTINISEILN
jgi:hypothetical protein